MTQKLIAVVMFVCFQTAISQTFKQVIKLEENHRIFGARFLNDRIIYHSGEVKSIPFVKVKKSSVSVYHINDFSKMYEFDTNNLRVLRKISKDGFIRTAYNLVDDKGNNFSFHYAEDEVYNKYKEFNILPQDIITNNHFYSLIKLKKTKKKDPVVVYMIKKGFDTKPAKVIKLDFDTNKTYKDHFVLRVLNHTEDWFQVYYFPWDQDSNELNYTVLKFNYEGKLLETNKLEVNLGNSFFLLSRNSDTSSYEYPEVLISDGISYENLYYDEHKKEYYFTGLFSSKKTINNIPKDKSILVIKYDENFKLIWKSQFKLNDKIAMKKTPIGFLTLFKHDVKDGKIALTFIDGINKYCLDLKISDENGSKLEHKYYDNLRNRIPNDDPFMRESIIPGGLAEATYSLIDIYGKNIYLDHQTLGESLNNEKFKSYLNEKKNSETKLQYSMSVNNNRKLFIESDVDKNEITFLMF